MKFSLFLLICIAAVSLVYCGKAYNGGAIYQTGPLPFYTCMSCDSQWQCKGVWAGECRNQNGPGECCMKKADQTKGNCRQRMYEGYPCTPNEKKTWTPGGMMCPCNEYTLCHKGICKYAKNIPTEDLEKMKSQMHS